MGRGPDKRPRKPWLSKQVRTCPQCRGEFIPKVSVQIYCRECVPAKRSAFWRRIVLFGVGKREFDAMLLAQENKCAICREVIGDEAHVDHDHVTMQVRGLLCRRCNLRLCVLEDATFVLKAQAYLAKCSPEPDSGTMVVT